MKNLLNSSIKYLVSRYSTMNLDKWKGEYDSVYQDLLTKNIDMKSIIEANKFLVFCGMINTINDKEGKGHGVTFIFPKKQFLPPMDKDLKEDIKKACRSPKVGAGLSFLARSVLMQDTTVSQSALHYLLEEGELADDINFVICGLKEEKNREYDYLCGARYIAVTNTPIVYN